MEEQKKYVDEIFHFKGKWEMPSLCGVQQRKQDGYTLVILTELYEQNPGSSVTGMVAEVATEVVKKYEIDPATSRFIVHNPQRGNKYEFFAESFYEARMKWEGEKFTSITWKKIEGPETSYL